MALADWGAESVCDADPCDIAVFEVFESDDSDSSDSSESGEVSCDYSGSPSVMAFIVDECISMGEYDVLFTCTGTKEATVSMFMDGGGCTGTATMTMPASAFGGENCGSMVACGVEAGESWDNGASALAVFAPMLIAF